MVSESEFYNGIPFEEREEFDPYILKEEGYVYLSPIGELILLKYLTTIEKKTILLSPRAFKFMKDKSNSNGRENMERKLEKLLDPIQREINRHDKFSSNTTDLEAIKEGTDGGRVFYLLENEKVKVCLIEPDHNKYETMLNSGHDYMFKKHYENIEFKEYELSSGES
jgi:hypothetical protein